MINLYGKSRIMTRDETVMLSRTSRVLGQGISYVDGEVVVDETQNQTYALRCNVQPVTGQDLQLGPEGQQMGEQLFLYAQNPPIVPANGDTFERTGETFQVQGVENWGNYVRALAINSQFLADTPDDDE